MPLLCLFTGVPILGWEKNKMNLAIICDITEIETTICDIIQFWEQQQTQRKGNTFDEIKQKYKS